MVSLFLPLILIVLVDVWQIPSAARIKVSYLIVKQDMKFQHTFFPVVRRLNFDSEKTLQAEAEDDGKGEVNDDPVHPEAQEIEAVFRLCNGDGFQGEAFG